MLYITETEYFWLLNNKGTIKSISCNKKDGSISTYFKNEKGTTSSNTTIIKKLIIVLLEGDLDAIPPLKTYIYKILVGVK